MPTTCCYRVVEFQRNNTWLVHSGQALLLCEIVMVSLINQQKSRNYINTTNDLLFFIKRIINIQRNNNRSDLIFFF